MVIRGNARGNGKQLSQYLLAIGENELVQLLDVDRKETPTKKDFQDALLSMSLTAELSKSDKGLYHAQINPAIGEDKLMNPETWLQAADILGKELGLQEQRRSIVLHHKKGRVHAHVVWQRFDTEKGIMRSDSFSRLAQDRARMEMEKVFEHTKTPHRNIKQPEMKQKLTAIWRQSKTAAEFIKEAKKQGYIIAAGIQKRPFMVVDSDGRSFDLIRQLDGIKTKEVRERLAKSKLPPEKVTIDNIRNKQLNQISADSFAQEKGDITQPVKDQAQKDDAASKLFEANKTDALKEPNKKTTAKNFSENHEDIKTAVLEKLKKSAEKRNPLQKEAMEENTQDLVGESNKKKTAKDFGENRDDIKQGIIEKLQSSVVKDKIEKFKTFVIAVFTYFALR